MTAPELQECMIQALEMTAKRAEKTFDRSMVTDDCQIMGDLCFESRDGVAFLLELEEFGYYFRDDLNPFWDDQKRQNRTFREMLLLLQTEKQDGDSQNDNE